MRKHSPNAMPRVGSCETGGRGPTCAAVVVCLLTAIFDSIGRAADLGVLVASEGERVERFAAAELSRYASRIGEQSVAVGEHGAKGSFFVGLTAPALPQSARDQASRALARLDPDSFVLRTVPGGLLLAGASPRGSLYAVYAYLESLGVRWYFPGPDYELVPRGAVSFQGYDRVESPDFRRRGLTLYYQHIDDPMPWVEFAARQRLNTVFFHDYGGWWARHRDRLWPEMQKRGLELQVGGHYLYGFRNERLFNEHPDWFRERDGHRTAKSNLCVSSQEGLAYWTSQAVSLVRERIMEADTFHLWPDDGGAWCECSRCRELSPADQSLALANAFAAGIRQLKPKARIAFLAYGETMQPPPKKVRPAPGVFLLPAPRGRCYGHALTDPKCGYNRKFRESIERQIEALSGLEVEVFEYYVDQARFPTVPYLGPLIAADLRYYHQIGVSNVGPLTLDRFGFQAIPVNFAVYARCEWDLDTDAQDVVEDLCERYFRSREMVRYYEVLGDTYARFVPYYHFEGNELDWIEAYDRAYGYLTAARVQSVEPYLTRIRRQEGDVRALLDEHAKEWNHRASGWGAKKGKPHEVSAIVPLDLEQHVLQKATLEIPAAAVYAVSVWAVRGPARSTLTLRLGGRELPALQLRGSKRAAEKHELGRLELTAGEHRIEAQATVGEKPLSSGFALMRLTPVSEP